MRTNEELIELVKKFSNAFGPSGFEDEVAQLACHEVNQAFSTHIDSLRNTYLTPKNNSKKKPLVWLDAHSDEVGLIIQAIHEQGTMDFLNLGGISPSSLPCNKVRIQTNEGHYVSGIISTTPPHFLNKNEAYRKPDINDFVLDIGASSKEEVENDFGVSMANPAVFDVECTYNKRHDLFLGKAFDCRVGCAALIETLNRLTEKELDVDIIGTLTSQEEVGERGSKAAADIIDADICICFEGCPADDTFTPAYKIQSALKKGPMLRHFDCSMITNPHFQRYALNIDKKHSIPVQESVRRGGGTNGGAIHCTRHGVPCIVIGIPVRYIHTSHCYCTLEDTLAAIQLATCIIETLNADVISQF